MKSNFILLAVLFSTIAYPITEKEIIDFSVKNGNKFRSALINLRISSTEKTREIKENSGTAIVKGNIDYVKTSASDSTIKYGSLALAQPIVGGGDLSVSVSTDSLQSITATFEQPILKSGLGYSTNSYNRRKAEFNYQIKKEGNIYEVLSLLADLRIAISNGFLLQEKAKVLRAADSIAYFSYMQTMERFRVGDLSPLDTLESLFNYGNVQSRRLRAERDLQQGYQRIKELSGLDTISLISISSAPIFDSIDFVSKYENILINDPELRKFKNYSEIFELERHYWRNNRLPELNVYAGISSDDMKISSESINTRVGLKIAYQLFNSGALEKQKIAGYEFEKQTLNVTERKRKLKFLLQDIQETYKWAFMEYTNTATNVRIANMKREVSLVLYKQGQITTIERMKSEQDWIETSMTLLDAEAVLRNEQIRYDLLSGEIMSIYGIDNSISAEVDK